MSYYVYLGIENIKKFEGQRVQIRRDYDLLHTLRIITSDFVDQLCDHFSKT